MTKYRVEQDCYFAEKGNRCRYMKRGDIYESDTMTDETKPKYFTKLDVKSTAEVSVRKVGKKVVRPEPETEVELE